MFSEITELIIVAILLSILFAILLLGFIACALNIKELIDSSKTKKYFGRDFSILNNRLLTHIESQGIRVYYKDQKYFDETGHSDAAGYITYHINDIDLGTAHDFSITILDRGNYLTWTVLVHEYGHYLSITKYNDRSEEGADYEAGLFLLDFLSSKEIKSLKITLNVFFGVGKEEFKNFVHKEERFITLK